MVLKHAQHHTDFHSSILHTLTRYNRNTSGDTNCMFSHKSQKSKPPLWHCAHDVQIFHADSFPVSMCCTPLKFHEETSDEILSHLLQHRDCLLFNFQSMRQILQNLFHDLFESPNADGLKFKVDGWYESSKTICIRCQ